MVWALGQTFALAEEPGQADQQYNQVYIWLFASK